MEYQLHEQGLLAMPASAIAFTVLLTNSPPVHSPVARAFFFGCHLIVFSPRALLAGPLLCCCACISYICDFAWRPRERSICPRLAVCRKLAIACYERVSVMFFNQSP